MTTLTDWMKGGQDAATCLSAPGAAPLTYAALRQLANEVQHSLNAVGIGRNDRVALVLPNSAEMAASFVTVAACCTSAPLNPSYRADEFEFYLNDLNAKALVVEAGSGSASIEVARKLGVSILVLHPTPAKGAGSFTLDTSSRISATAHLWNNLASKNRAIDPTQCLCICTTYRPQHSLYCTGSRLECHATVPYPRADRRHSRPAVTRWRSALHIGL